MAAASPTSSKRLLRRRYEWQTEPFFKWIKQHLRIKSYFGHTPNAVKTQVWIAVAVYVLVAILRKELNVSRSLAEILRILSVISFEKTPLFQLLQTEFLPNSNTLSLTNDNSSTYRRTVLN